ncbi:MAG TPA: Gfo/Idh/MocA family oxidoreductase [Candidatus Aminicenantes bacterium]|nr:Gfo/Idh/MocA family oxidoreductase [Candidatus Aminicenantes bacterium]
MLTPDLALIGAGNWGRNHLRNLKAMGRLARVIDPDPAVCAAGKKEHPELAWSTNLKDLWKDDAIHGVVIAAPAVTHADLARRALEAGRHVLVEKPLALTADSGKELTQLAEKKGLSLMVGHVLRYHTAVEKLKAMVDAGELGKIRYIYSNRLNIGRLRTEENVLWSFAPHDISLILMLLDDEEPAAVCAHGGAYLDPAIFDTTLTSLEFSSGVRAHVFVSWLHPFKEQKLVVVGSEQMAVFDDTAKDKLCLYPHRIKWEHGRIPVAQKADFKVVPVEEGQPLRRELEHFCTCVDGKASPLTDGHEAVRVLNVLEQAETSLKK